MNQKHSTVTAIAAPVLKNENHLRLEEARGAATAYLEDFREWATGRGSRATMRRSRTRLLRAIGEDLPLVADLLTGADR